MGCHSPVFAGLSSLLLFSHHLEYHRIMETLKFIALLVALPVSYWLFVELIDFLNRGDRS
jgi:hypothetical protein